MSITYSYVSLQMVNTRRPQDPVVNDYERREETNLEDQGNRRNHLGRSDKYVGESSLSKNQFERMERFLENMLTYVSREEPT